MLSSLGGNWTFMTRLTMLFCLVLLLPAMLYAIQGVLWSEIRASQRMKELLQGILGLVPSSKHGEDSDSF